MMQTDGGRGRPAVQHGDDNLFRLIQSYPTKFQRNAGNGGAACTFTNEIYGIVGEFAKIKWDTVPFRESPCAGTRLFL